MARRLVPATASFFCSLAMGQVVVIGGPDLPRASDAETQLIRDRLGLEAMTAEDSEKILSIDAYRWSDSAPYELAAFVWLRPIFAQGAICVAQEVVAHGRPGPEQYIWEHQARYHHWLAEIESECVIENSEELPSSVLTRERIPTDAMIRILESKDELLELTLRQLAQQDAGGFSGDWQLEEISVSSTLDPELGFSYNAKFSAPGAFRGPSCTFTIRDGSIELQSAGLWVV